MKIDCDILEVQQWLAVVKGLISWMGSFLMHSVRFGYGGCVCETLKSLGGKEAKQIAYCIHGSQRGGMAVALLGV